MAGHIQPGQVGVRVVVFGQFVTMKFPIGHGIPELIFYDGLLLSPNRAFHQLTALSRCVADYTLIAQV